jgi:ketosteroid isomerase-like protein
MTDDHIFIDSLGTRIAGREAMRKGWAAYFAMVPDYALAIDETFTQGDTVVLLGTAHGTYAPDGVLQPRTRLADPRGLAGRRPRNADRGMARLRR